MNNPGYHLGPANGAGLQLDGTSANVLTGNLMMPTDCIAAVRILDKSKINDGKKQASDAAYNMAAQLLAALLNLSAGAETCTSPDGGIVAAVNAGQTLLCHHRIQRNGELPDQVEHRQLQRGDTSGQ